MESHIYIKTTTYGISQAIDISAYLFERPASWYDFIYGVKDMILIQTVVGDRRCLKISQGQTIKQYDFFTVDRSP